MAKTDQNATGLSVSFLDEATEALRKGRGAPSNRTGRYEAESRHATEDGWWSDDDLPPLRTSVTAEKSKSIISTNSSPDIPFDRSINSYRGCEHGCVYCYARPTHAYMGLSPGLDFESRLFAKVNGRDALRADLAKREYQCKPIMLGAVTDPYQPIERDWRLTREILEEMADCRHPVVITTKSASILRDLDILSSLAEDGLVGVGVSVTTMDRDLARTMEPRASTPAKRLEAIEKLSDAGVPVTAMVAPMIPHLNDHELETLLVEAAEKGATSAFYSILRLPLELKELFSEWLDHHVPDRAARVLNGVRETREGELYRSDFATRMRGTGEYADLLAKRFSLACRKLGLNKREPAELPLRTDLFTPPVLPGSQMKLF